MNINPLNPSSESDSVNGKRKTLCTLTIARRSALFLIQFRKDKPQMFKTKTRNELGHEIRGINKLIDALLYSDTPGANIMREMHDRHDEDGYLIKGIRNLLLDIETELFATDEYRKGRGDIKQKLGHGVRRIYDVIKTLLWVLVYRRDSTSLKVFKYGLDEIQRIANCLASSIDKEIDNQTTCGCGKIGVIRDEHGRGKCRACLIEHFGGNEQYISAVNRFVKIRRERDEIPTPHPGPPMRTHKITPFYIEKSIIDTVIINAPGRFDSFYSYQFLERVKRSDKEDLTKTHIAITGFDSHDEALRAAQVAHEDKTNFRKALALFNTRRGEIPVTLLNTVEFATGDVANVRVGAMVVAVHPVSGRYEIGELRAVDNDGLHVIMFETEPGTVRRVEHIVAAFNPFPTFTDGRSQQKSANRSG